MRRDTDFFEDTEAEDRSIRNLWRAIDATDRTPGRKSLWTVLTLGATVGILFAVLWYSYPREVEIRDRLSAPIIRADATPTRIAPDDPGGMDIPHRDSAVFSAMNAANASENPPVENLLAAEEEPMPKARLFAGLNTEKIDEKEESEGPSTEGEPEKAATEISADIDAPPHTMTSEDISRTQKTVSSEKPNTSSASAPKVAMKAVEKPSPKTTSMPQKPSPAQASEAARVEPAAGAALGSATRGTHYVQLSSVRERGRADSEWSGLKKKFPGQLSALPMRVQKADLGAKGTYYRIQAGPLSKDEASNLCATIKKQKPGGCLVVAR
ncbi:MAG: SPOR domain-containing protein [Rhodospirillales bacterium]|nr:SPOR domain-containing protein [Rhodospirillales bacterium]